jgi:hypothetical protein
LKLATAPACWPVATCLFPADSSRNETSRLCAGSGGPSQAEVEATTAGVSTQRALLGHTPRARARRGGGVLARGERCGRELRAQRRGSSGSGQGPNRGQKQSASPTQGRRLASASVSPSMWPCAAAPPAARPAAGRVPADRLPAACLVPAFHPNKQMPSSCRHANARARVAASAHGMTCSQQADGLTWQTRQSLSEDVKLLARLPRAQTLQLPPLRNHGCSKHLAAAQTAACRAEAARKGLGRVWGVPVPLERGVLLLLSEESDTGSSSSAALVQTNGNNRLT